MSRPRSDTPPQGPTYQGRAIEVGDTFEVEAGAVAHGGHVVARLGDVVAFTRHALPGELIRIRVTEVRSRFIRADAIEVIRAHPERRTPLCAAAGVCGGCDFQHASEQFQRELKTNVMHEALVRHGRLDAARADQLLADGIVDLGLSTGWRSRMRYQVSQDDTGSPVLSMFRHRSEEVVDASTCVIAEPVGHSMATELASRLRPGEQVYMATGIDGPAVAPESAAGSSVRQQVSIDGAAWEFTIPLDGFWQVHPLVAQAIIVRLLEVAAPKPGETWWDLFAGAGPLAAALGMRVGSHGRVEAVEGSRLAVEQGTLALESMPWVTWHRADVSRWVQGPRGRDRSRSRSPRPTPQGVVLDPPRSGAGAQVLRATCAQRPRVIVVVACDPVALGRDTAILRELGYDLVNLRVWDAFPQTHHMEAMACFSPVHQIS